MAKAEMPGFLRSILTTRTPGPTFTRFNLPLDYDIQARKLAFREKLTDRFQGPLASKPATFTAHELWSKLGDVSQVADPVSVLSDFNEQHTLRIADLFKTSRNALAVAEQLAGLRQVLATWAFRLAAIEHQSNLALVIGGSGANGVLTFQTDYDFVVLPHAEADKPAARRVQFLMAKMLLSIGLEADWVMYRNFEDRTLSELQSFESFTQPVEKLDGLQRILRSSNASFFRFMMDIKLADVFNGDPAEYARELEDLKQRLVFSAPANIWSLCDESFRADINRADKPHPAYLYDIKTYPLRLLHYALYASRAKLGISDGDQPRAIVELAEQGVISAGERDRALAGLSYFVGLRHLISLSGPEVKDATKISREVLANLAQVLGQTTEELSAQIESSQQAITDLAAKIIERVS